MILGVDGTDGVSRPETSVEIEMAMSRVLLCVLRALGPPLMVAWASATDVICGEMWVRAVESDEDVDPRG